MAPLFNTISKVGFGAYRATSDNPNHRDALLLALKCGCTLIDTSSTYMNGKSEELIGSVLAETVDRKPIVVTKGGYIQNDNLKVLAQLQASGRAREDVVSIREDFMHSIHPEFLESQINQSLHRLKLDMIDVYLLHNPEYYFRSGGATHDEYYARIRKAFVFLEEQVNEGRIHCYGVSSNTLPVAPAERNSTDLLTLIEIAKSISSDNHFRVVEFPYNLAEHGAAIPYEGRPSLLKVAKDHGIVTLGNRPLNCSFNGKPVRLAVYDQELPLADPEQDSGSFDLFIGMLTQYLKELGNEINLYEVEIVSHLSKNWMRIGNPDAAEKLFRKHLHPVVSLVYSNEIPAPAGNAFQQVLDKALLYARKNMAETSRVNTEQLFKDVPQNGDQSRAAAAIQKYLTDGVDHVLVGMLRTEYVKDLKEFLIGDSECLA